MKDRTEYFKEYRQRKKAELAAYFRKKYQEKRKERLTYQRTYYILNRTMILAKAKKRYKDDYHDRIGHIKFIYSSIKKFAKLWKIPYEKSYTVFKVWAINDESYNTFFDQWKDSNFENKYGPVVHRGIYKHGFVTDNLKWDFKNNYSWWNGEHYLLKELQDDISNKQPIANEGIEGQKDIVKKSMKGKRYSK